MTTQTNETHPNYPFMEASETFFAIEIEVAMPNARLDFQIGGYHNGIQIPHYPTGWNSQSDISISAPTGYTGLEIVSPKLKGFDGFVQIVQVLDDLNERGAIVNHSTGLHVHVDGRSLDIRDIKKVKQMFGQYEKLFYGVLGYKANERYENTFCHPSRDWIDGEERQDRYRSLNLRNWHNYEQKKTIEFRLFAGTLEAEPVLTYIMMCVGLVVRSRNCTRIHKFTVPAQNITDLCKKFVANVLSKKTNQIVPEYSPERGDSLYKVLYDNVPNSTIQL